MAYLALYRKFRPTTFDDVVGQDHIVKTLTNQIKKNQVGHAYLFTGSRGTGKTTCAKIFSKAVNCLSPIDGSPCGKCEVCKALSETNNVDIFEIDAASNNGVNEIRELREKIKYPPINGKYKVYIIDEVHMLTDSAFNALLKTLEEPPAHAIFILATTEVHKLPATILSRCMRFDFRLLSVELLIKVLKNVFEKSEIAYDEQSVGAIANAGEGSVRDTLSIADCVVAFGNGKVEYETVLNILGLSDKQTVYNLADQIIACNVGGVLDEINTAYNMGKNLIVLGKDLTVHFRNLLVIKNCQDSNQILNQSKETYELWKAQAEKVDNEKLLTYMEKFSAIEAELKYTLSPRVLIEITALECASLNQKKKLINDDGEIENLSSSKTETIKEKVEVNLKPNVIWGKVIYSLRQMNLVALHTACGEIRNVEIDENVLTVFVKEEYLYNVLKAEDNFKNIEKVLRLIDNSLRLNVEKQIPEKNVVLENKKRLLKLFDEKLKIVD